MQLDSKQKELFKILKDFISTIPQNFINKILSLFKKNPLNGVYIYGGVGRGKTMIVKHVLSKCQTRHKIVHFQQFMQDLHKSLHLLRTKTSEAFLLHKFVSSYAKNINLLFIDELEVKDIADAMILKSVTRELINQNVKVIFTSNLKPSNLYMGGIQREFFLPFIQMIEEEFLNFYLDNNIDYRTLKNSSPEQKMFFKDEMHHLKKIISRFESPSEGKISLYGRELAFKKVKKDTLITDFHELFERSLSSADYIEICKYFKIVIVENIRPLSYDETDIAIRLINFIDNAYLSKTILFCSFLSNIDQIYPEGTRAQEFKRTISRLQEMNSSDYN